MAERRRWVKGVRRIVVRAIVLLLLGAIINVAVAWVYVYCPPILHAFPNYAEGFTRDGDLFSDWSVDVGGGRGRTLVISRWLTGSSTFASQEPTHRAEDVLPSWAACAEPDRRYPASSLVSRVVDARGWPALSMMSCYESIDASTKAAPPASPDVVLSGFLLPSERTKAYTELGELRVIPVKPIWPGFAINTIFYAAILWLPVVGLGALRRRRRIKRGLCPECAYPVGDSAVCTECGTPRSA